jgi:CBS domain-containing protein
MRRIPPIKAVMTPFPNSIEVDRTLAEAQKMMTDHDIRHLPVVERGDLIGVITARDVRLAAEVPSDRKSPIGPRIQDICVRETYVVDLAEPLDRVLLHMARHHIDSALVVKEKKLAGIFTMTDACRSFGELLQTLFPAGGDDQVA